MTEGDLPWGVYTRISRDMVGTGLGVARQEKDCRRKVEDLGGSVAEVYCDNDTSAYASRKRPEYERMLSDAKAGKIKGIVAWHIDRLTRRPAELESLIDLANQLDLRLATCTGDIDLSTPQGRLLARQLGSIARYESEHRSERIVRKHLELAEKGSPTGGFRPFGYESDQVRVREDEAAVLKELAQRALAGESLNSMVKWLNDAGVPTVRGGAWNPVTVKNMLINPRLAGMRTHRGVIMGKAMWPAILDQRTHKKLVSLLTDASRKKYTAPSVRTYLLTSGMSTCGLCGVALRARPNAGVRGYVCDAGRGGCGKIRRNADKLEEFVASHVLARLATPEALRALTATMHAVDEETGAELIDSIEADELKLADLGRDYADGLFGKIEFQAARGRLASRIETSRKELSHITHSSALPAFDTDDIVAWWNEAPLEQQRALVGLFVDHVEVFPVGRGHRTVTAETNKIHWR